MILFDLDHFKKVNDTWGHPIGDEVLIQTAQTVKKVIRSADHFFRIGGEEFLPCRIISEYLYFSVLQKRPKSDQLR